MGSSYSSSASCSPSSSQEKHDVFISFRGEDTRDGFTSFLYEALRNKAIQAYMDDHQLQRGDEISPTLMKAIEESTISVIIFSENCASSTWCLNELVKILECQKKKEQIVIPVFYRIDPSIVRKQKEGYAKAFAKLEERFKDEMEKVNQWRKALKHAADLSGLDSDKFRPEPMLIRKTVDAIWSQLRKKQTSNDLYKGLYGIQKRINKIERLLRNGSTDNARIIGICGMGGIGKTTLASFIFLKLIPLFEDRCFLEISKEVSAGHRLDELRKKLLTELFNDRAILSLDTPFVVSPFIGDRFRRKKVLIVLDDVDCSIELEALIKGYEELAPGSRIIVTTRDAHVLKNVTDEIYEVEGLDTSESLDLFHLHAFKKERPAEDYKMLSERVADYANGNPLALKVLGSFLYSRPIEDWERALKKLEMVPDKKIQKVLRISYEGLDDMWRELFLDIACFFSCSPWNFEKDDVEGIVDEDYSPELGISVLKERSLVTIVGCCNKTIRMHNLLQQMGFAMVFEEHKEPGNRSRLCIPKDISHVLETASGTETIKSMSLHLCDFEEDVKVHPAAFSKMSNLQYLQIISHENSKCRLLLPDDGHGLEFYPSNKLRYFSWAFYPFKSFPSGFIPENLVQLILTDSQLVEFWNEDQPAPPLEKLKCLELHGSKNLTQVPNLSRAINIESISLAQCTSLVQVPSYFKDLHKLQFLDLTDCSNLIEVERISAGKNLRTLNLGGTALEKFPEILEPMECLMRISLSGTMIKELPQSSIEYLNAISDLDLSYCQNIEFLLNDLCCLRNIYTLNLQGCSELQILPPLPHSLVCLIVTSCENLKSIQELPPLLTVLHARNCTSLETVSSWRTPHIHKQGCTVPGCSYYRCSYRFNNCQKLDQNLTNNIIPHAASLEILCAARSPRKLESKFDYRLSVVICYPGDDIPNYFISHIDPGTSINIDPPSNCCDDNFLGFAFCFVLDLSEVASERLFDNARIECVYNFNDDCDVEHPHKVLIKWDFECEKFNSDHVLILYDHKLSYKELQYNFGANWPSIVTKSSFDFRLSFHYVDGSKNSSFRKSDGWSLVASHLCHKIIKKCGVWLIYDLEDGGKLMDIDQKLKVSEGSTHEVVCLGDEKVNANTAAAAEEETRCLTQLSLVSGSSTSHDVVCFEDQKVNTNTDEEDQSYPNTSVQEEPSYTEWLPYIF